MKLTRVFGFSRLYCINLDELKLKDLYNYLFELIG